MVEIIDSNTKVRDKYMGIMDCHGLEYFHKDEGDEFTKSCRKVRAMSNDQRQALYFECTPTEEQLALILVALRASKYEEACRLTKEADGFDPQGPGKPHLIPDPDIDPWYSGGKEDE